MSNPIDWIKAKIDEHAAEKAREKKQKKELERRLARVRQHRANVAAAKRAVLTGQVKEVKPAKGPKTAGAWQRSATSGGIAMTDGDDMYQMPVTMHRAPSPKHGQIHRDGAPEQMRYINITTDPVEVNGTADFLHGWFARQGETVLAVSLEVDYDAEPENSFRSVTVEVGVSDATTGPVRARYLGGRSQVVNEVAKNVGSFAAGAIGGGGSHGEGSPELAKDSAEAVQGVAERVVEHGHKPHRGPAGRGAVYSRESAEANLQLAVHVYAGDYLAQFGKEHPHVHHTWDALHTATIDAESQRADRSFLYGRDVAAELERLIPALFDQLERAGKLV